jgi:hypothetical protein
VGVPPIDDVVCAEAVDVPEQCEPSSARAEEFNADHAGAAPAIARICRREIMMRLLV